MTRDDLASLNEDLSAEPLQAEVRDALKVMIERGVSPSDVAEAALVVASALCLDVEGLEKVAIRLLTAGTALANSSPALQQQAADRRAERGMRGH